MASMEKAADQQAIFIITNRQTWEMMNKNR